MSTIHTSLKEQTRAFHGAVESRLGVLMSKTLSLQQYMEIVKKLHGFYQPIESQLLSIREWDDAGLNLQQRQKLPLLVQDLVSLHVEPDEIAALPCCCELPGLQTVSQAFGCLYVLEGSTLGGKIITRHLKEVLHLDETNGCSFFNSYGSEVGTMWRGFLDALARYTEHHGNEDVIVASACRTFEAMDQWLAAPLPLLECGHV
jgi:heme oxygenase